MVNSSNNVDISCLAFCYAELGFNLSIPTACTYLTRMAVFVLETLKSSETNMKTVNKTDSFNV